VKDGSVCRATIPHHYKEAYLNLYCNTYDNKALKQLSIAKMHSSLDATDSHTNVIYTSSKQGTKHSPADGHINLTVTSPITNSVTTASMSRSTNTKKTQN
jgi:hypothetical protein